MNTNMWGRYPTIDQTVDIVSPIEADGDERVYVSTLTGNYLLFANEHVRHAGSRIRTARRELTRSLRSMLSTELEEDEVYPEWVKVAFLRQYTIDRCESIYDLGNVVWAGTAQNEEEAKAAIESATHAIAGQSMGERSYLALFEEDNNDIDLDVIPVSDLMIQPTVTLPSGNARRFSQPNVQTLFQRALNQFVRDGRAALRDGSVAQEKLSGVIDDLEHIPRFLTYERRLLRDLDYAFRQHGRPHELIANYARLFAAAYAGNTGETRSIENAIAANKRIRQAD